MGAILVLEVDDFLVGKSVGGHGWNERDVF